MQSHLADLQLGLVVVMNDGRYQGPFNRSAAYNRGIRAHPDAAIYVFHEADMLIPGEQLQQAIDAASTPGLVVPFTNYRYLDVAATEKVQIGADPAEFECEDVMGHGRSNGAVNVMSAETMQAVGQWDEKFEGWGWDDRSMAYAFEVTTGHETRYIEGPGFHMHHEPGWVAGGKFYGGSVLISKTEQDATARNRARYLRYLSARTVNSVQALTRGGR